MKVRILEDEWYPVYVIYNYGNECDIHPRKVARWKKTFTAFYRVQQEMRAEFERSTEGK
jgi:hypothetical protein